MKIQNSHYKDKSTKKERDILPETFLSLLAVSLWEIENSSNSFCCIYNNKCDAQNKSSIKFLFNRFVKLVSPSFPQNFI